MNMYIFIFVRTYKRNILQCILLHIKYWIPKFQFCEIFVENKFLWLIKCYVKATLTVRHI